ncbi:MAG: hypothetical protein GXO32_05935 [Crenarchaeota archaeon]|nr:hypothetical protein [Thermoproteota archaeon]
MSYLRRLSKWIFRVSEWIVTVLELLVIVSTTVLAGLAIVMLVQQFASINIYSYTTAELTMLVNSVFMLIIFAEIIRCVAAAHGRPEAYILAIAEAGFVIAVREIFISALTHDYRDLVLSSGAALVMAVALWVIKSKVLKG